MNRPVVTLEQWQILEAVVDHGSFQAAADVMFKSQSSISYSMRQLQQNLGVDVFQHKGRRAILTSAGEQVLRKARALLEQAKSLERNASDLAVGWEPEVTIAVDAIFPDRVLLHALEQFAPISRGTRLEIVTTVLSGSDDAILQGKADIAITSNPPVGFIGESLVEVEFSAVTSPAHLLLQTDQITEQDLAQHRQIVVRDSGIHRRLNAGWLRAEQRWTVTSFQQSISIIKQGLGFAFIPTHMILKDLEAGLLQRIKLDRGQAITASTYLIFSDKYNAGPATNTLAEEFRLAAKAASSHIE